MAARWRLRFDQFARALALLESAEGERRARALSDVEKAGLVQFFELTTELGWKTMGTYLSEQLVDVPQGPLGAVRAALANGLIADGDGWAEAIRQRNQMAHVYDMAAFDALVGAIGDTYLPLYRALKARLDALSPEP